MQRLRLVVLASALWLWPAAAFAQIISTMLPVEPPGGSGSGVTNSIHLMAGFAKWSLPAAPADTDAIEAAGGRIRGDGHRGFIFAGDFSFRATGPVSVGVGGWYNKVEPEVVSFPADPTHFAADITQRTSFSSIYGNVFYGHFGVQAGLAPVRIQLSVESPPGVLVADHFNEVDFNLFAVGRFGQDGWVATVGGGFYRYGTRPAGQRLEVDESPAANTFSAFANTSIRLSRGLSVDASFWFTGGYEAADDGGFSSQSRVSVGLGYSR
jgi:hypothetical protein